MAEQENETTMAELEVIKAILAERWGQQESTFKEFFDVVLAAAMVSNLIKHMPITLFNVDRTAANPNWIEDELRLAMIVSKSKPEPMPEESEDVDEYIARIEQIREAMKRNQKEIDQLKAETRSLISELLAA